MTEAQENQGSEIKDTITSLVEASQAMTAMLITKEGTVISEAGDTSYLNTTAMAALVAGMFSATHEVARMVGERQFSILLQQGENRHIHISLVTDSAMMVIVFEGYQRIGRVRHEARRVATILAEHVARTKGSEEIKENISVPEFKEYALNLIDRIFVNE